jgi:DNA-binding transcriptional regulator YiaG
MTPDDLKKLRLSWGLDQKQLAEKLGVQQSRISDWEQGRKIPPYIVKHLECLQYASEEKSRFEKFIIDNVDDDDEL